MVLSNPLVTVITPVYNHEEYLDEYFQSIINQTYENIQFILIDDQSSDRSKEVIENWIDQLKTRFADFIYIPRTENKGLIYNCNEGLELASGTYISIFASDDIMLPSNIEEKVLFLEKNQDYAIVYSDTYYGEDAADHSKKKSEKFNHLHGNIFNELIN